MHRGVTRALKFAAGLLLAPVFAVALLLAVGLTVVLIEHAIDSRGNWEQFEGSMRHYSDRLEATADGALVMHEAAHPVAMYMGVLAGSWVVALLLGYAIERLRRNVWAVELHSGS